jgi:hypothetical protein
VGRSKKELKQELVELEVNLNNMRDLKIKACSITKNRKSVQIDAAVNRLNGDLRTLRLKQSTETAFRAK